MHYSFDQLPPRQATESVKWRAYPADVLPMFVADMDFVSPEPVQHALRAVAEAGLFGYPRGLHGEATELPELAQLMVERLADRYGWHVEPQAVIFLPGIVVGLNIVGHMFREQGGTVVVQPPVYPPFLDVARNVGLMRSDAELLHQPDGTYVIDWARLENALTPGARLFILCNPHNPVGRVFRRDELERVAQHCLSRGVTICSDEIHSDLIYRGQQHLPLASLDPEIARHTVTFFAPSKTFNLPGLQASVAIIPNAELRQRFQAARQGLVPWVNLMGLVALEAAYRGGQEWLDRLLVYLEVNRDFLYDFVRRELPGLSMAKPEGTYLAWLDCRAANLENPFKFFLDEARVALGDGANFGPGGQGFVRLTFGCPRSMLEEALMRMKKALTKG
jgi:cystathionine beta-lyase